MSNQQLSTNTFCEAKWVVSPNAYDGTHTSISSAIASASSGDTIFIRPGTYTENPTLKAGVNLTANICDAQTENASTANVIISGTVTASYTGAASISGICLQTNSSFAVVQSGSNLCTLILTNCFIHGTNNTAIQITNSAPGSFFYMDKCRGNLAAGNAYFSASGAGKNYIFGCSLLNDGGSVVASTISSGAWDIRNTFFANAITNSGVVSITISLCTIFGAVICSNNGGIASGNCSYQTFTSSGTGSCTFTSCNFFGSTNTAITVGSGCIVTATLCDVNSSNANAISGTGTLNYANITFSGTSSNINTTTQNLLVATDFQKIVVQTFTSGTPTYTPTAGMKYCTLECIGSGGAGGGGAASGASSGSAGGGGGAGGYARKTVTAATIGSSQTVTVGAAGTAGSAGNNPGGNGNTSSVGVIVTATGGSGGSGCPVSGATNISFAAGGAGGTGTSGDFNSRGGAGTSGYASGVSPTGALSGNGGSSVLGGGAAGVGAGTTSTAAGNAGGNYGAGGSGGYSLISQAAVAGGNGSSGLVIITEYI